MTPRPLPPCAGLIAALLATLVSCSGCSFLAVDGPPPERVRAEVHFVCTTSSVLPILDVLGAGLAGFRAADDGSSSNASFAGRTLSRDQDLLVAAGAFATLIASSAVGFKRVEACKEATAEAARRDAAEVAQREAAEAARHEADEAARQRAAADAGAPSSPDASRISAP